MKLNTTALMTAGGIGAVVSIILSICANMVSFAPIVGANDISILGILGTVGTVALCCAWVINLAIGFAYVYFAAQRDGSVQVADGAVGGAISTAIAAFIGGLLTACIVFASPLLISQGNVDALTNNLGGILTTVATAVCGGLIGGAIVGAIGGLIGALTIGKPKTA
jgi:hypothetical protein